MRLFAALYAVVALFGTWLRMDSLPWFLVCVAAAVLAAASVARRPLVMAAAAHAGLTATWAGTVASRVFQGPIRASGDAVVLGTLLALCAGMVVLISAGLKAQAHLQPAPVRNR